MSFNEPQKRKYDGGHQRPGGNNLNNRPYQKRPRHENSFSKTHSAPPPASVSPNATLPTPLPELPKITRDLEAQVLTHPGSTKTPVASSYERLEFLGDAYIEVCASTLVFHRAELKGLAAGRLSQVRELLVKNETLAKYTSAYSLDTRLKVAADVRSEPKKWLKTRGDVFEAYIAAIVLSAPTESAGMETARNFLEALWKPVIVAMSQAETAKAPEDAKSQLAKRVLAKGIKLDYVDEEEVKVHKGKGVETYHVGVYLTGWGWENQCLGTGKGLSRKAAGIQAAGNALDNPLLKEVAKKRDAALAEQNGADGEAGS